MKIQCSHCSQHYEVESAYLGKTITCQTCGKDWIVMDQNLDTHGLPENRDAQLTKPCPYCSEQILSSAKKCKHCGEFLDETLREKHDPLKGNTTKTGNPAAQPWRPVMKWILIPLLVLVMVVGNFVAIGGIFMEYSFPVVVICEIILGLDLVFFAGRKGYNKILWFLSGFFGAGLWFLGLLILAFLPFVNTKSKLPEELRVPKKKQGNIIAVVLAIIGFVITLVFSILSYVQEGRVAVYKEKIEEPEILRYVKDRVAVEQMLINEIEEFQKKQNEKGFLDTIFGSNPANEVAQFLERYYARYRALPSEGLPSDLLTAHNEFLLALNTFQLTMKNHPDVSFWESFINGYTLNFMAIYKDIKAVSKYESETEKCLAEVAQAEEYLTNLLVNKYGYSNE